MDNTSGVGVLDKAVSVLAAVESGPATLAQLVAATGLARPTTHRIAVALEHHRLLATDGQGRRPGLRGRRRAGKRAAGYRTGRRGAADDRRLGRAGPARLGGGRADAPGPA